MSWQIESVNWQKEFQTLFFCWWAFCFASVLFQVVVAIDSMYQSDYLFYCFVKNGKEKINCLCLKHSIHETYSLQYKNKLCIVLGKVTARAHLWALSLSVVTKLFFFLLAHLFCAFLFALQQYSTKPPENARQKKKEEICWRETNDKKN